MESRAASGPNALARPKVDRFVEFQQEFNLPYIARRWARTKSTKSKSRDARTNPSHGQIVAAHHRSQSVEWYRQRSAVSRSSLRISVANEAIAATPASS